MRRAVWVAWFITSSYALILLVQALDHWATTHAMAAAHSYCRGSLVTTFSPARTATCVANWLTDARGWIEYAHGILAHATPTNLYVYEALKVGDVLLFVIGLLCFGFALSCLWANIATQGVLSALGAIYTLTHGVTRLHARSRA
jgi:hypothetical protein